MSDSGERKLINNPALYFYGYDPRNCPVDKDLYCVKCGEYHAGTGYCRVCKNLDDKYNLARKESDSGERDDWRRKKIEQLDRAIAVCDAYLITVFGSFAFLTVILVLSLIDK